ncbi:MAG TPA: GAF domain-containing protein [Methylomirabilota bacterium]
MPLLLGDRLLGVLAVGARERRHFTDDDVSLLQALANQGAVAVDNAQRFAEERARRAHLTALLDINKKIGSMASADALLSSIAEEAARLLGVDNAGFRVLEGDDLVLAGVAGAARETMVRRRIKVGESLSGKVVQAGRTLVLDISRANGTGDAVIPEHRAASLRLGYVSFLGVPLRVGDRIIGVFTFRSRRAFTRRDEELAEAFAGQAAIAIEHSRLYREARHQAERMSALADLGRLLSETLDPDKVGQRVADAIRTLLGARSSALYRLDPESESLVVVTVSTVPGADFQWTLVLPPGTGLVGIVVRDRLPQTSADVLGDPRVHYTGDQRVAIGRATDRALLAVPLVVQDRLFGVLAVGDTRGRVFDTEQVRLAQAFADQAAIALENARLFREGDRRRREAEALARVAQTLTESLHVHAVGERVVESVLQLFDVRSAGLRLLCPDGSLVGIAAAGASRTQFDSGTVFPPGVGLAGRAVIEGRPQWSADVLAEPGVVIDEDLRRRIVESGDRALLAVPLRAKGEITGVLSVADEVGRRFSQSDIDLLGVFADQAAMALENARLFAAAREYGERLRAVEEVNRLVSSSLDMDDVLRKVAGAVAQFLDAPYVSMWVRDPVTDRLRRSLVYGDQALAATLESEMGAGEGAVGWVVRHREPIPFTDIETDDRLLEREALLAHGLRFFAAYPIAIGDRVLGAFAVARAEPTPVTPETASLLGSLAGQAAVALDNARLHAETTRQLEQSRSLLEVMSILNSTLESRELLKRVAIKIAQVCRVDRCSLERWDGGEVVRLMAQFADGRRDEAKWRAFRSEIEDDPRQLPAHARAIATRRPVIIDDTSTTDQIPRSWITRFGIRSYLIVPLVYHDRVIGVMNLDYCERVTPFAGWQVELATAIAGHLALSLENTRLYGEVQERLRETSTLLEVADALSGGGRNSEVMRRVARAVARAFAADTVGAYAFDARLNLLTAVAGYHVPEALRDRFFGFPIRLARFPALLDAWQARAVRGSADSRDDPGLDREWTATMPPFSVMFAPTLVRGEPVGALFLVWWRRGRTFSPAELRLLEGISAQVGLALENTELGRQTQQKLHETETLLAVSRALTSTLDLQTLMRHFLRRVTQTLGADSAGLWMLDEGGEWMSALSGYHVPPSRLEALKRLRLSVVKHEFYAQAVRTRRPAFTTNAHVDSRFPAEMREGLGHQSQLFVPVVAKEELLGGFAAVWWEAERDFSASELALMEAIANQAGVAIENARLFEENRRRVEELSVLNELSRAVTGQLDEAALLQTIRVQVPRVLASRSLTVLLYEEATDTLNVALRVRDGMSDLGDPRRYPARGHGLMASVFGDARPLRTDDYVGECGRRGVEALTHLVTPPYWLGVPLATGDTVLGVLNVSRSERPFSEADERLLANIADLATLALRSARLFEDRTRAYGELAAAQDQLVRTEKLRALGEMASGVAHDFNNLLASILGRAQLLLNRVQEPQQRLWLEVFERSALDGAQTVRRLQDFTRIRRDEPLVAVDLNDVVMGALDITQSRWRDDALRQGAPVNVERQLAASLPAVPGDPAELREALTNLILNAVDAMPQGGTLTIATAFVNDHVEVTVRDTGVGIPESVREKIFDPFFTTKGPRGTGLGLSMTYGILSRHGARIDVETAEGQGTTFRLTFRPGDVPAPPPAPGAPARPERRALHCLVVDDEPAVAGVIADILGTGGHETVVLHDGAEAIARAEAEPFDVVFTDLAMPGVTGWQVAAAVKARTPSTPVVLVTGFGVELSAEERRAHGVDAVLVKPLKIQELLDAAAAVARKRGKRRREGEAWPTIT